MHSKKCAKAFNELKCSGGTEDKNRKKIVFAAHFACGSKCAVHFGCVPGYFTKYESDYF